MKNDLNPSNKLYEEKVASTEEALLLAIRAYQHEAVLTKRFMDPNNQKDDEAMIEWLNKEADYMYSLYMEFIYHQESLLKNWANSYDQKRRFIGESLLSKNYSALAI